MMLLILILISLISFGTSTLPSLKPFNFTSDLVSQTAMGKAKAGFAYRNGTIVDLPYGSANTTLAIDLVNKRWFLGAGFLGRNWFLPTMTCATVFSPLGVESCGCVNSTWELEVLSLSLMNNKGESFVQDPDSDHPNRKNSVYDFYGLATDNTQCNSVTAYGMRPDSGLKRAQDFGFLRRILADTPLDTPQADGSIDTVLVKQYYEFYNHVKQTPSASYFTLPDICNATNRFDWCGRFFSRGLIALYNTL